MARTRLKKLRLQAGKTQTQVAKAVGTSQPNYQRWETEKAKVPPSRVKKLAKVLGVAEQEVLGEPKPFDFLGADNEIEDARTYYGEVALHFFGGGAPLLLPVSEEVRINIQRQFDSGVFFIKARSLDNRLVFVRREALADLYLSSEAYDDFGPEEYPDYIGVVPNDDFWFAGEYINKVEDKFCIDYLPDELEEDYVKEVFEKVVLTDEKLDALIANGTVKEDDKDQYKRDADIKTEALLRRAKYVTWQFSNGRLRHESIIDSEALLDGFYSMEFDIDDDEEVLRIPFVGYERTVLINKKAVDYISVPAHTFDSASLDEIERELDN